MADRDDVSLLCFMLFGLLNFSVSASEAGDKQARAFTDIFGTGTRFPKRPGTRK